MSSDERFRVLAQIQRVLTNDENDKMSNVTKYFYVGLGINGIKTYLN